MMTFSPLEVSVKATLRWSPWFMNRSLAPGVNVAFVAPIGLAGACDLPLLVMNAKLTYSSPALARQVGLFAFPVTGLSDRLSMFIAAHHWVGLHELAPAATRQVGHCIHPGG
jgi:hypothetical protein